MIQHPAFLYVGPEKKLKLKALEVIKGAVCSQRDKSRYGCHMCADCINAENKNHHLVLWLAPENYYTVAQLEIVFKSISFALQPDEHFFIVFERAELFNQATANSLLKSLEEPPRGYHFLLLAQRLDGILPTIQSRCVIEMLQHADTQAKHPLFYFFTSYNYLQAAEFAKEIDRHKNLERDIYFLLDQVAEFWCTQLRTDQQKAEAITTLINQARMTPPMPGSAKRFLKNLYLTFFTVLRSF